MSLINKMNVGNTNYDIQDRLMPDAIGQAGQVLKVKDDGSGLEFSTIESGGGKLYKHSIYITLNPEGNKNISFTIYSSSDILFTADSLNQTGNYLSYYVDSSSNNYGVIAAAILSNRVMARGSVYGNNSLDLAVSIVSFTDTVTEV